MCLFSGSNATIQCTINSVPISQVRWFYGGQEILNGSLIDKGVKKFVIQERVVHHQKMSQLVITNSMEKDNGQYMCMATNNAGKAETNFTLKVGYFSGGVSSLKIGEIAGIAITLVLLVLILLVMVLVLSLIHI